MYLDDESRDFFLYSLITTNNNYHCAYYMVAFDTCRVLFFFKTRLLFFDNVMCLMCVWVTKKFMEYTHNLIASTYSGLMVKIIICTITII